MTRLKRLLPLLALLAFGCKAKPPAHRMGTSVNIAPTGVFQVIPATMDPNAANLPGAVGTRVQNAGGANAWDKGTDGLWHVVTGASGGGGTVSSATAPLVIADGGVMQISAATDSTPGSMSAADKTKLDGYTSAAWFDAQANFLRTQVPGLTECNGVRIGASPLGGPTTLVAGNYTDGFIEGGAGVSQAPTPLSKVTVWQSPKAGRVGLVVRVKFPAISANLQQIGLTNNTNGLQIAGTTAIDATHWVLRMNNPSESDFVLSVADNAWHDLGFIYDGTAGTPTLVVTEDKVTVGTFTGAQLNNFPTTPSFPQSYSADSTLKVIEAEWCYVAP